jgi:hypothetical protein
MFDDQGSLVSRFIRPAIQHISVWVQTCADYWGAAATYEQLSRLSDAELHSRRLSRMNLARDICQQRVRAS